MLTTLLTLALIAAAVLIALLLHFMRHLIRARKELESKTKALSLQQVEQMRVDFVANVSHELRTPLTAIKGYADTLILDLKENRPIEKEFLEVISRHTERLMSLINDLLDLSSLESGESGIPANRTRLSTQDVSWRVIKQMHRLFELKRHRTHVEIHCDTVNADPRRLEQVLINLLENACKYTPESGDITVRWSTSPKPGGALLSISDTGPGIPAEHHARLFERFYRVDKGRSRELGGTGLGLSIVKHIMQEHQGTVWVESQPGKGSTFYCEFGP